MEVVQRAVDNSSGRSVARVSVRRMRTLDRRDGPSIEVDVHALDRLAGSLRELVGQLHSPAGTLADALADSPVRTALQRAEHDWSEQRTRLRRFLERASDSARRASVAYSETDGAVRNAATPR